MKATIAKDNDFKTVGFEVTSNKNVIFSWGVTPNPQTHFCKEVNCKDWETDIISLIMTNEELKVYIRLNQDLVEPTLNVHIKRLEDRIKNIISNIS